MQNPSIKKDFLSKPDGLFYMIELGKIDVKFGLSILHDVETRTAFLADPSGMANIAEMGEAHQAIRSYIMNNQMDIKTAFLSKPGGLHYIKKLEKLDATEADAQQSFHPLSL